MYLNTFSDLCSVCPTNCCSQVFPPITPRRHMIIDRFLGEHGIALLDWLNSSTRHYSFPKETPDGYCIFFDKTERTCRIHMVKPETCRAGPITFDIDYTRGQITWFMKPSSECLIAAALRRNPDTMLPYAQMAKTELLRLIKEIEPRALQALLNVEEPTVLRIGEDSLSCLG